MVYTNTNNNKNKEIKNRQELLKLVDEYLELFYYNYIYNDRT